MSCRRGFAGSWVAVVVASVLVSWAGPPASGQVAAVPTGNVEVLTWGPGPASIRVAGWALLPSAATAVEIHLHVDGAVINLGPATRPRPDVGAAFPAAGPDHGFDVSLAVDAGTHVVSVYAVSGSPTLLASRTVTVGGSPIGHADLVVAGPGPSEIHVAGWVIDPDMVDPSPVHVYVDGGGHDIGPAFFPRPDVDAVHPGYVVPEPIGQHGTFGHGFNRTFSVAPGVHRVQVYAIDVGGSSHVLLADETVRVGGSPVGHVDLVESPGAGAIRIAGWTIDPDTVGPIEVHAYIDGGGHNLGPADLARPDVAAAYGPLGFPSRPGYGELHGFDRSVAVGSGPHEVCVYAINVGLGANTLLGCLPVTA